MATSLWTLAVGELAYPDISAATYPAGARYICQSLVDDAGFSAAS
jgi:hypothetical protein